MTIQPAQNTELIPGAYRDVYHTLFSFLNPRDLSNCACVCKSLNQRVKDFNAPERIKRACKFVTEVMTTPMRARLIKLVNTYLAIMQQRPLTPQEWEELRPWITSQEAAFQDLARLNPRLPGPEQLLSACEGEAAGDKKALLYDITSEFLNPESQTCYRNIAMMACELLIIMGPRENEPYVSPATRAQTAVEESKEAKKVPHPDIEDAVWFLVSNLSRQDIAEAEEACRTLVQIELAKLEPREVEKMGQTLAKTFPSFKQLVEIYQKIETTQSKAVREGHFTRNAVIAADPLRGLNPHGHGPLGHRGVVRLIGGLILGCSLLIYIAPSLLFPILKETPIIIGIPFGIGIIFSTFSLGGNISSFDRFFEPRAEIRRDAQGAEVVHIIPHPLRGGARVCSDLISVAAIAYCITGYFGWR